MSNFNTTTFLADAKKVHHNNACDTLPDTSIRSKIDGFINYDKVLFSKALDDICNNIVGNTMFTLLMTKLKLPAGQKLRIVDIGPDEAKKTPDKQTGSSYSHAMHAVKINLNVYDKLGVGIPDRQYYCVDETGNIALKLKSVSSSLFHEFTHCLHHMEDWRRYDSYRAKKSLPDGDPWSTKEERRTIAGYIEADVYELGNTFDPICDNCFHLYDSIMDGAPYRPRIVHCGCRSNNLNKDVDNKKKLLAYLAIPEVGGIIKHWQKYVID